LKKITESKTKIERSTKDRQVISQNLG
jgi:hypothetical protein